MTDPDLEAALRAVEPAARLVPERRLLRLLVYLRDHGAAVPLNAEPPFWVSRNDAIAADVLPPAVLAGDSPSLLLLTNPDDRLLAGLPRAELLRAYWRLVFRARVAAAVRKADPAAVAAVLDALGPPAVREIRYVLEADHRIDPRADAVELLTTFAATFLDLRTFAPAAVADTFPSLPPVGEVVRALAPVIDPAGWLAASRPIGAAGPGADARTEPTPELPHESPAEGALQAAEAEARGNYVRAAIVHVQAATKGKRRDRERSLTAARDHIGLLVHKLADILGWDRRTARRWKDALTPLLPAAARGRWPRAARCLYELQKVTADLSGGLFAVDLIEWGRTLGRRPVVRPLPRAREVRILTRLRAAHAQLLKAGVPDRTDATLLELFHDELHRIEDRARHDLTPVLTDALDECGFRPANRVEGVARDKLVAELLDRVCERGFLRLGDLRDAVARNRLKMPDLRGPGEFFAGDPLLKADTRLSTDLDGVYRRGEFYLRWLQRASSLFFGTPVGRVLTLYLIGPFLAAFLLLMTIEEFHHLGSKAAAVVGKVLAPRPAPQPDAPPADDEPFWWPDDDGLPQLDRQAASELVVGAATSSAAEAHHGAGLVTGPAVLGLGLFFLLVFHVPPFRRAVLDGLRVLGRGVRVVVWDLPRAVWGSPLVRAIWYSRPARLAGRWLGGPLAVTAAVLFGLWLLGASPGRMLRWGGVILAAAVVALNTAWGRVVQDRFAERLSDAWRLIRVNLLPGLVGAVLDGFARLANWVEARLYAVDEWFRYRRGDSRGSVVGKALLGLVWFPVAYLARFAFYLLIEPQINPVKHFPVVTVSHKVLLPLVISPDPETVASTGGQLLVDLFGLGVGQANFWAFWIIASVPGVFGFIAWELMANWRLYAANRPGRLGPVTVGSHGESVRGLLRPGFHSGTVPKQFGKLRAAARRGDRPKADRAHHELDHVREAVHRFAERELVGLLDTRPGWADLGVAVGAVRFGCQRLVIEVVAPAVDPKAFALAFENRSGTISAGVETWGWADRLDPARRDNFRAAVRGLSDMAAADPADDDHGPPFTWADWVARWGGSDPPRRPQPPNGQITSGHPADRHSPA